MTGILLFVRISFLDLEKSFSIPRSRLETGPDDDADVWFTLTFPLLISHTMIPLYPPRIPLHIVLEVLEVFSNTSQLLPSSYPREGGGGAVVLDQL